jgi:aromatase
MTQIGHREVEHRIAVDVPAAKVYRLLADVTNWPRVFPPTIHAEQLERSASTERIRIWATANGEVKTWTSRRELDQERSLIEFRQEISQPPVASMAGTWIVEPVSSTGSVVRLLHEYRAIDDDPERLAWLDRAVDTNSRTELAALKANVEAVVDADDRLAFTFSDSVDIHGAAKDVYDFLNEAGLWQTRLPHVARVNLAEPDAGLQILEMDTNTKDGSTHTTRSVRVCFPHDHIVYKQITLPPLMTLHTGRWQLTDLGDHVTATSWHTVSLNEDKIPAILGDDAGIADARAFVRTALGTNSVATLRHAKEHAESRH